MIGFWIAAGVLLAATLAGLLWPLIRQRRRPEMPETAVAVFRRELADIEVDLAQGRLEPDAAEAVRAEITRRLLAAADRPATEITGDPAAEMRWRTGAAVVIAALLPAAALGVYFVVGAPAALEGRQTVVAAAPAASGESVELAAAAEQLAARLDREPDHPDGWILLARTDAALGRFDAAADAYRRAIGLSPGKPELHAELGEILVAKAQGRVTPEAEAEFAKAPTTDPRARYYQAEAALQRGDKAQAAVELRGLLAAAPAEAPWRATVAAKLAEISGTAPPAANAATGPSAEDVAAAQSMSPEARQTMIRGMVERLAARLEQHPDDREGWARLAHAYDVLGEPEKAAQARAHIAAGTSVRPPAPTGR